MVIPSQCAQLFHSYFCSRFCPLSLRAGQGWAVVVQEPGLWGACCTNRQWSWSRGGRMLRKAWAVLEPTVNAQEALTRQGPH